MSIAACLAPRRNHFKSNNHITLYVLIPLTQVADSHSKNSALPRVLDELEALEITITGLCVKKQQIGKLNTSLIRFELNKAWAINNMINVYKSERCDKIET